MNRLEVLQFLSSFFTNLKKAGADSKEPELKSFLNLVLSLKQNEQLSIPVLRDLAALITGKNSNTPEMMKWANGAIRRRIDRRYQRLCRIQEELGRLDLQKAAPGISAEDYIFSRIDFSRYREIDKKAFEGFFIEGFADFDESLFKNNFRSEKEAIQTLIKGSYKKTEATYQLQWESPLILSIMRTLETSLETTPLFTIKETEAELRNLLDFVSGSGGYKALLPGMDLLYPHLISGLDDVRITHMDGMTTKLFVSSERELSGTFRPGNKPWTLVLIPDCLLQTAQ